MDGEHELGLASHQVEVHADLDEGLGANNFEANVWIYLLSGHLRVTVESLDCQLLYNVFEFKLLFSVFDNVEFDLVSDSTVFLELRRLCWLFLFI